MYRFAVCVSLVVFSLQADIKANDCFKNITPDCIEFEDFYGYHEFCSDTDCEEGWGGWECPSGTRSLLYSTNTVDWPQQIDPGETGLDTYTFHETLGLECAGSSSCSGCNTGINTCKSDGIFDPDYAVFIHQVNYSGDPCPVTP